MGGRRRIPIYVPIIVVTVLGWFLFWPATWLELELTTDDGVRQTTRLVTRVAEPFAVRFIHSVELHPVIEYFTLDETGAVILTGTRYHGFGAGLPTDGGEGTFSIEGDAFVISGLQREIGQLRIRLSPLNDYTVLHRGHEYRWPGAPAGARLTARGIRSGSLAVWLTAAIERGR